MKKRILRYLKHILVTILVVVPTAITISLLTGNALEYGRNDLVDDWENEGPYVFFENDSLLSIHYIKGNRKDGFYVQSAHLPIDAPITLQSYYPLDSSSFEFSLNSTFENPKSTYKDDKKILAISDIESNYKTFRDFLINSRVIDKDLNWTFGENHLVLVGDFIDRSYFSTQVLWFIYKLEQEAKNHGGNVHFILGNHELMNMQGNHKYAKSKYRKVAAILGKQQFELYSKESFIGRWLNSKNTLEILNGNLFVHGGIHPDIANVNLSIEQLNQTIRVHYYKSYYPKKDGNKEIELLTSSKTSPYWYRGYFKGGLTQQEINKGLEKFNAKAVIVGHTIQPEVNRQYDGKVIGIDVKHPQDAYQYFPKRKSQGLLIDGTKYYRVLDNGQTEELK